MHALGKKIMHDFYTNALAMQYNRVIPVAAEMKKRIL